MRILLAVLAALVLALAGCTSSDDGGGDGTPTPTPTTSGPSPTTTTGPAPTTTTGPAPTTTTPPAENTPPTATLSATTEEGTFNVSFSVDGADEDGDELTWTLDVDGDGEADYEGEDLPDEVVHTYAAAGNFTANLTVSDGQDETTRSVPVVLESSGASSDGFSYEEMALTGSSPGADVTGALECPGFLAGESGINCVFTEVPAGLGGLPYTAVSDVATAVVVDWWDACDATTGASLAIHLVSDGGPETVPDGAGCVVMASFGVVPMPVMSLAVGDAVTS